MPYIAIETPQQMPESGPSVILGDEILPDTFVQDLLGIELVTDYDYDPFEGEYDWGWWDDWDESDELELTQDYVEILG